MKNPAASGYRRSGKPLSRPTCALLLLGAGLLLAALLSSTGCSSYSGEPIIVDPGAPEPTDEELGPTEQNLRPDLPAPGDPDHVGDDAGSLDGDRDAVTDGVEQEAEIPRFGTVQGEVIGRFSMTREEPLARVEVELLPGGPRTVTEPTGRFVLHDIRPGDYRVRVKPGAEVREFPVTVRAGQIVQLAKIVVPVTPGSGLGEPPSRDNTDPQANLARERPRVALYVWVEPGKFSVDQRERLFHLARAQEPEFTAALQGLLVRGGLRLPERPVTPELRRSEWEPLIRAVSPTVAPPALDRFVGNAECVALVLIFEFEDGTCILRIRTWWPELQKLGLDTFVDGIGGELPLATPEQLAYPELAELKPFEATVIRRAAIELLRGLGKDLPPPPLPEPEGQPVAP